MKEIVLDFGTWRAEITISDDTIWQQICVLISNISGIPIRLLGITHSENGQYISVFTDLFGLQAEVNAGDHLIVSLSDDQTTPLHEAAKSGNLEAIRRWLTSGSNVNDADDNDCIPLSYASMMFHEECVTELLESGANAGYISNNGWTILHWIAYFGGHSRDWRQIVKILITAGCNPTVQDKDGNAAAELARIIDVKWGDKFARYVADAQQTETCFINLSQIYEILEIRG